MSVVQMSVSAAFIIVACVIVRALFMHKLPKRAFLALWGIVLCRLLIPVSIPAKTSVFGLIAYIGAQMAGVSSSAAVSLSAQAAAMRPDTVIPPAADTAANAAVSDTVFAFAPPLFFVWLAGIAILGCYFASVYFKCRREFSASLPIGNDFITAWREAHRLKRDYSIRMSDKITVPLTYGVFRPVILLPKRIDLSDEKQLSYILAHEFVHIRRFDALVKLAATAALCVHWFNPLVWVMFILLNRDIEISCDEKVVRELGETPKSAYALMLIGMAERKGAFSPLYSGFSRYAIEERVNAIMKNKKISMLGMLLAFALVVGTITVFATSAVGNAEAAGNGDSEKIDTGIAWARGPGGEIPEAPYHAPAGMSTEEYLYSLGFLEYDDTTYFQPIYRFNGKWAEAIYDPNIWRGYDYSNFVQSNDVNKRFGEAVGVKVVRDAQTNEITGLVEMTDEEMNAARAGLVAWEIDNSGKTIDRASITEGEQSIPQKKTYVDLSNGKFDAAAKVLADYQFYTNTRRIAVSLPKGDCEGTFTLFDVESNTDIQVFTLDKNKRSKTFTNLTASANYYIAASGIDDSVIVTVTD
ncbi:MAG: M56 family metallopeptidase [Clostridiales Family XIII bacterium]|jgi:beta-lactamase regulating signal transducer with metallopeptidase domain|nr:M56 family metallopeptidase [Clostridiales Family XIII bacterium]